MSLRLKLIREETKCRQHIQTAGKGAQPALFGRVPAKPIIGATGQRLKAQPHDTNALSRVADLKTTLCRQPPPAVIGKNGRL